MLLGGGEGLGAIRDHRGVTLAVPGRAQGLEAEPAPAKSPAPVRLFISDPSLLCDFGFTGHNS